MIYKIYNFISIFSARGVYYVTTNAHPPYARGFPGKSRRLRSVTPYS